MGDGTDAIRQLHRPGLLAHGAPNSHRRPSTVTSKVAPGPPPSAGTRTVVEVGSAEEPQRDAVGVVVVGLVVPGADREHRAGPDEQRHRIEPVLLGDPPRAGDRVPVQQMRPLAVRDIEPDLTVRVEDRRDQQRVAEHVLGVQVLGGGIVREFQHHRPEHRGARFLHLLRRPGQVRHQRHLQPGESAGHLDRLVVEGPRHPVRAGAMQPAVAGQQAERQPALEDAGVRGALEAADVVGPVAEAAGRQRQPAAQGLGHRCVGGIAVAAPVHRVLLAAGGRRAGEQHRLACPRAAARAGRRRSGCTGACSSCASAPGRTRRTS